MNPAHDTLKQTSALAPHEGTDAEKGNRTGRDPQPKGNQSSPPRVMPVTTILSSATVQIKLFVPAMKVTTMMCNSQRRERSWSSQKELENSNKASLQHSGGGQRSVGNPASRPQRIRAVASALDVGTQRLCLWPITLQLPSMAALQLVAMGVAATCIYGQLRQLGGARASGWLPIARCVATG